MTLKTPQSKLPNTGTTIRVVGTSAQDTFMQVLVNK